jgi:hypothetical protein
VGTISSGFKQVFYITAEGVEVGSGLIGVKSEGFTAQLREQDEAITMCLKEIALAEWERLKGLDSPYARLGIMFSLTLAQTHSKNTMSEHLKQVREAQVPPATVEKHADL